MSDSDDGGGRPSGRPPSYRVLLAAIVAGALVIRLAAIALDGGYEPRQDSFDYDRYARSIAAGDGFPESNYVAGGGPTALRAPGYPGVLGIVYALPGPDVIAGRVAGAVLGALTVLLLFLIVARVWGERIGLTAAGLAAVYPPLIGLSTELWSENLFIPLLLAAVLAVLRYRESASLRWAALAGALAGLAALTRGPGVIALIPLLIGLWMLRPRLSWHSAASPLVALACAALVVAPWATRNAIEFGRFVPIATSTGFGLAGTYNSESRDDPGNAAAWRNPAIVADYEQLFSAPGVDEATLDAELRSEAIDSLAGHPAYAGEAVANNLLRLFYLQGGSVVDGDGDEVLQPGIGNRGTPAEKAGLAAAVVLATAGIAVIVRARRRGDDRGTMAAVTAGPTFVWLIPIALIVVALPVAGLPRYRVPADPFLLILAAIGLTAIADRLRGRRGAAVGAALAALALTGAGCGGEDTGATTAAPAEPPAARAAFIERADAVCRDAIADARKLVAGRFSDATGSGDPLQQTTEGLVAPGIRIRERQARRLRAIAPEEDGDQDLATYLGLFDPIGELSRLRLQAGRDGDPEEATRIERLLGSLALDQQRAAIAYGFDDCSKDVIGEAFK